MNESGEFDALLKARFDREHGHVPADAFVAAVWRKIRAERRFASGLRMVLGAAALVTAVVASPWLIAGARWITDRVDASLAWTYGLPGAWMLGVAAAAVLLFARVRN